jgi:hypothetical protein
MKLIHQSDFKRTWERADGVLKIEVFTTGTGKRFNGSPAVGHWKTRGYKDPETGRMESTLRELKNIMKPEIERAMHGDLEAWDTGQPGSLVSAIYQMKRIYMAAVVDGPNRKRADRPR